MPSSREYTDYVSYIDREDAKINLDVESEKEFSVYHSYMDYMGDELKQGALFTNEQDNLSNEDLKEVRLKYKKAEKNGSPMWQDVISFDNNWLEKQGLYIVKTGELDEKKMMKAVRASMNEMLHVENMKDTSIWSASIHYNTDNIHVHVATVEPVPTREKKDVQDKKTGEWKEEYRAKRKQKSLDKMKSKVINNLLDRNEERNKINDIIRGAVKDKKENDVKLAANRKTKRLFLQAMQKMPDDMRQWKYGYQSVSGARPLIDEISDIYLNTYHKKDMKELHQTLDEETQVMKELYGEKSEYKNYKETKLDDLKKRMGNAVITEMRTYRKNERLGRTNKHKGYGRKYKNYNNRGYSGISNDINYTMKRLQFVLLRATRDHNKDRNMREYEKLLEEQEKDIQ